jgi:colanic acid biosynthesis glycosyl transferase WcaI
MSSILLVSDTFPPEVRSASVLMRDLADYLSENGHEVTVCTARDAQLQEECKSFDIENQHYSILRIRCLNHRGGGFIHRGLAQLLMPFCFILGIIFRRRKTKFDYVIVYSPPLPLFAVGAFCKLFLGSKFIMNIQDLFPQNAVDLGIIKNKFIIQFFRFLEYLGYRSADVVTFHSPGNRNLTVNNFEFIKDKSFVVHNWFTVSQEGGSGLLDLDACNFSEETRAAILDENICIGIFAGVLGPSQGLDVFLNVLSEYEGAKKVYFIFLGDGLEKNKLVALANKKALSNVAFYGFRDPALYSNLLEKIDFGLASLNSANKTPVVPGKILNYMDKSVPIFGILNTESDGHDIINSAECGCSVSASAQLSDMVVAFTEFLDNSQHLSSMGSSGRSYLERNFATDIVVKELFDKI